MSSQLTNLPLNPVLPFPLPLFYPNAAFPKTSFFPRPCPALLSAFGLICSPSSLSAPSPYLFLNSYPLSPTPSRLPPSIILPHPLHTPSLPVSSPVPPLVHYHPLCYQSLLMLYLPYPFHCKTHNRPLPPSSRSSHKPPSSPSPSCPTSSASPTHPLNILYFNAVVSS